MLPEINAELTAEQIEQLEQARKMLPKLREQMRRAEAAGLDMSAQKAELEGLQAQLDKLYRVYVRRTTATATTPRLS